MDFLDSMDSTQTVCIALTVVVVILALVYLYCNSGSVSNEPKQPANLNPMDLVPMQTPMEPQDLQEPEEPATNESGIPAMLALFFSPGCIHCKNMAPVWDELTQNFNGYNGIQIVTVNGAEHQQLCQMHNVQGFPTVKFCPKGVEDPQGAVMYNGDRSLGSLVQFLKQC
jgi:thiol-disulfide isomerase/thioredoxin